MRLCPPDEATAGKTTLRVLFFEDDIDDLDLTRRALADARFEVVSDVAVSIEQFRKHLQSKTYDVILSDYRMPGNTGMDCFEALIAEGVNTPFILVTGSLGDEKAVECLKQGVADYVLKDRLARLPIAIRRALEEQRLKSEQAQTQEVLRRQNLELEEKNRRIEAANRMKSEFLANMSHELRSPLNGIIGFTELLYDGKLGAIPAKPREFLNRIHRSAKHLLELINGVLDLSKIEAGRMELRAEWVGLSSAIQEVTGILGALAAEKGISIETAIEPTVENVCTDAGRFKQILHNYLSNAIKFTGDRGRIRVRLAPEGLTEFRLEVSDTGIGIPAGDIPRLFVEFQQLDSTMAKRYQGTGLGLALTKRIVEAQGGRVGVESRPGEGSTFYAVLPRCVVDRAGATAGEQHTLAGLAMLERALEAENSSGEAGAAESGLVLSRDGAV